MSAAAAAPPAVKKWFPEELELLAACRDGDLPAVRRMTARRQPMTDALQNEALRVAAEFGHSKIFSILLHAQELNPDEQSLTDALRWALRYDSERLINAVLTADQNRWLIPREWLEKVAARELRKSQPDAARIYFAGRLFS